MTVASNQTETINLDRWVLPDLELERPGWGVPQRDSWKADSRFRQVHARRKTGTVFTRFNRHFLAIQAYHKQRPLPEAVIDLAFVEPSPREVRDYKPRLWLAVASLMTIPLALFSLLPTDPVWLVPPMATALMLMVIALQLRKHYFEFLALNSDVVVFRVDAGLPDKVRADAFIEELSTSIASVQRGLPTGRQRIPVAVAEMRRLSEDGVISREEYEAIKRNWFRS